MGQSWFNFQTQNNYIKNVWTWQRRKSEEQGQVSFIQGWTSIPSWKDSSIAAQEQLLLKGASYQTYKLSSYQRRLKRARPLHNQKKVLFLIGSYQSPMFI